MSNHSHDDEQAQILLDDARQAINGHKKSEQWPLDRRGAPKDVPRDPTAPSSRSFNDVYYDPGKAEQGSADAGHRWSAMAENQALPAIRELNEGIDNIRTAAEVQEVLDDLTREQSIVHTTPDRVDERTAEGIAAGEEAARHRKQLAPLKEDLETKIDELEEHVGTIHGPPPPHGGGKPAPPLTETTTLEQRWITRHLRKLPILIIFDLIAIALGLEPSISAAVPMSFVGESLLLAVAVGGVCQVAGMLAGFLISRLFGQRTACALLLVGLCAIAGLLFHHVELVRDGVDSSIFLSDVSALAMLGAAVIAYITAVNLAADHRRQQLAQQRQDMYGWMDERTSWLTQRADEAKRRYFEMVALVENLERVAEQAPVRVAGEYREGNEALVRANRLPDRLDARLQAEHGHTRLRITRGETEYHLGRNLEAVEPGALPGAAVVVAAQPRVSFAYLAAALVALLVGIVAWPIAGTLLTVAAGAAAGVLILLAGLLHALHSRRGGVSAPTWHKGGSGSLTDRLGNYVHLPRTMEPRHGSENSTSDTL